MSTVTLVVAIASAVAAMSGAVAYAVRSFNKRADSQLKATREMWRMKYEAEVKLRLDAADLHISELTDAEDYHRTAMAALDKQLRGAQEEAVVAKFRLLEATKLLQKNTADPGVLVYLNGAGHSLQKLIDKTRDSRGEDTGEDSSQ